VGGLGVYWQAGRLVDWLTVWLIGVGGYVLQDEEKKKRETADLTCSFIYWAEI